MWDGQGHEVSFTFGLTGNRPTQPRSNRSIVLISSSSRRDDIPPKPNVLQNDVASTLLFSHFVKEQVPGLVACCRIHSIFVCASYNMSWLEILHENWDCTNVTEAHGT